MRMNCICETTAKFVVIIWKMLPNISFSLVYIYAFWTDLEHVALGKPTWQQHPYYTYRWGVKIAVDEKYSDMSYFAGKQYAISAYSKRTAEWRVDLGRLISIHHVFIQYLTNNQPWSMLYWYWSLNTFASTGQYFRGCLIHSRESQIYLWMSTFSCNEVKFCLKNVISR